MELFFRLYEDEIIHVDRDILMKYNGIFPQVSIITLIVIWQSCTMLYPLYTGRLLVALKIVFSREALYFFMVNITFVIYHDLPSHIEHALFLKYYDILPQDVLPHTVT